MSQYKAPQYTVEQLQEYGLDFATYAKLRGWIARNCDNFENSTQLAEAAAAEFDPSDTWLDCEHHPIWEVAIEFDPDPCE